MCFSASASFTASAVLFTIGIVAIKKSTTPQQRLLACIPLLFSIQQFTEGWLWIGLSNTDYAWLVWPATYIFLVFAQVIWPVMIPFCMMKIEPQPVTKKILSVLFAAGIILSSFLCYFLFTYPVYVTMESYHIHYELTFPEMSLPFSGIYYFIPTVLPPLFSSIRKMRILGIILLVSYIITKLFYETYLVSVWCYFASIISIIILLVIVDLNRKLSPALK